MRGTIHVAEAWRIRYGVSMLSDARLLPQVFVDHPSYHRPGTPYGDTRGAYGDNQVQRLDTHRSPTCVCVCVQILMQIRG